MEKDPIAQSIQQITDDRDRLALSNEQLRAVVEALRGRRKFTVVIETEDPGVVNKIVCIAGSATITYSTDNPVSED